MEVLELEHFLLKKAESGSKQKRRNGDLFDPF